MGLLDEDAMRYLVGSSCEINHDDYSWLVRVQNVHHFNEMKTSRLYVVDLLRSRDVHGNGKCGIPIPPVGFPWEWDLFDL